LRWPVSTREQRQKALGVVAVPREAEAEAEPAEPAAPAPSDAADGGDSNSRSQRRIVQSKLPEASVRRVGLDAEVATTAAAAAAAAPAVQDRQTTQLS
jgi:hypothetical protein